MVNKKLVCEADTETIHYSFENPFTLMNNTKRKSALFRERIFVLVVTNHLDANLKVSFFIQNLMFFHAF